MTSTKKEEKEKIAILYVKNLYQIVQNNKSIKLLKILYNTHKIFLEIVIYFRDTHNST